MKAAYIKQPGPPEAITYGDLPDPQPAASQVLVRVKAVAVNPIDTYIRGGLVKAELPSPFIIGCGPGRRRRTMRVRARRGSSRAIACGPATKGWPAGRDLRRAVRRSTSNGSIPRRPASTIVGRGRRARGHHGAPGLVRPCQAASRRNLFVNGGTGGVGSTVVQMAKAAGARVITTAGSDEKVASCRELGADLALNYKTADVDAEIRKLRAARRQRLVGDAPRTELRSHRRPAGHCAAA